MSGWLDQVRRERIKPPVAWSCNVLWSGNRFVHQPFEVPGLKGLVLSVPSGSGEAGGDLLYITVCGQGAFSKFLLVDVAGHGEIAAPLTERLREPLRRLMQEFDNVAILRELNRSLLDLGHGGGYATAEAATYNHWDRSWVYAYAGHPSMLLRTRGRWRQLPQMGRGTIPAGVLGKAQYYQDEIRLREKQWILLFSDALLEIGARRGAQLGLGGLIDLISSIDEEDIGTFCFELVERLVQANGDERFEDDLTFILLKHATLPDGPVSKMGAWVVRKARRLALTLMKQHGPKRAGRARPIGPGKGV